MKKVELQRPAPLLTSTIPESFFNGQAIPQWWASGTYDADDVLYYIGDIPHKVYQSTAANNTTVPGTEGANWTCKGTTDRWCMFDDEFVTQSLSTGSITNTYDVSGMNYVGLFNCLAISIELTYSVDGVVYKNETIDMDASIILTWEDWFWGDSEYRKRLSWEFPKCQGSRLEITWTFGTGLPVGCGACHIGNARYFGQTLDDGTLDISDYSYKDKDPQTGNMTLMEGNSADEGGFNVRIETWKVPIVRRILKRNVGKIAIYDFNNEGEFEEDRLFCGIAEQTQTVLKTNRHSTQHFNMQGTI